MNETTFAKVTARMLRNMEQYPKHNSQPCAVCGKHNSVTVIHHIIPVERVAKLINNGLLNITAHRKTVWLCPTCHAYVHHAHKMFKSGKSGVVNDLLDKIKEESNEAIAIGTVKLAIASLEEENELIESMR